MSERVCTNCGGDLVADGHDWCLECLENDGNLNA
jgi:hypothetical protein